jgi:hypothetical protein
MITHSSYKEDSEFHDLMSTCAWNTEVFAKTFFPDRFSANFSPLHRNIFDLIDSSDRKTAIAAPRGFGKTSIVALALMARHILFRITPFIVYINQSYKVAAMQTENLKWELTTNPIIKKIFGSVKAKRAPGEIEETFSKEAWVAYDTLILPRGSGQQVRGVLYKNDRPGLIIFDDLEDADTIQNEEIRKARKSWFFADAMKSVSHIKKDWKAVYIDTLKHEDALIQNLLESSDWKSVRLEACDDNFKATAPEFMSDEEVQKEVEIHRDNGEMDVFYREYRNLPVSKENQSFTQDLFKYYNSPGTVRSNDKYLDLTEADIQIDQSIETIVICDPAKTVTPQSAETAIVGIGIDVIKGRYFFRDCISEKMFPDEIYKNIFSMATNLGAKVIGIEETSLNEFIKQPIKNEMFKQGLFFELVWLKPRGGVQEISKASRIKQLIPYYRRGYIYHNINCCGKLEEQLLSFPRSRRWDVMDAFAYLIPMLEEGSRYFNSDKLSEEPSLGEFAGLEYEECLTNWRYV